jgi:hypothetical protein
MRPMLLLSASSTLELNPVEFSPLMCGSTKTL